MYDIIIIGGGPAGLSAAVYAARFNMKTVIVADHVGGYMMECPQIENYPGFKSVTGMELTEQMQEQVKNLDVEIVQEEVVEIKDGKDFSIKTKSNKELKGKNIVLALGTKRRKLEIKGEDEFAGRGVSYCATCDGMFFKDKTVAVVGGANSAVVSALLLARFAKQVNIIYRKEKLRADPYWIKKIEEAKNIDVHCCLNIKEIKGDKMVNSIALDNGNDMAVDGVFVEIGSVPAVSLIHNIGVKLSKEEYIIVDEAQKTNVEGIFAAGDITTGSNNMRQIITACAEGAVAAESAYDRIK